MSFEDKRMLLGKQVMPVQFLLSKEKRRQRLFLIIAQIQIMIKCDKLSGILNVILTLG